MLAIEAKKLGYSVGILDPNPDAPACQVADFSIVAEYSDEAAVASLAERCDVLTFEFENVLAEPLRNISDCLLRPSPEVLHIAQNREREKTFLRSHGIPCADFEVVGNATELQVAASRLGGSCILKTADFGYDGKGQMRVEPGFDPEKIWGEFGVHRGILEARVEFAAEVSVICARWENGFSQPFPVAENIHRKHILDVSIVPARIPRASAEMATRLACEVASALDVVGLLGVEMFLLPDGGILVNELAPRPHNSGHFSFDACVTSQFEQHLRAVCGLPAGSADLFRPVVMVNLLGDLWVEGVAPDWAELLSDPNLKLHLYGKTDPRPGRKMGHFCVLGEQLEQAIDGANRARELLQLPRI